MFWPTNKLKTVSLPLLAAVLLTSSLSFVSPQKAFAAGEQYEWQGANIRANLGVFTQGPGDGSTFNFGPNNAYLKTGVAQQGVAPLALALTHIGDMNYYGASQNWKFIVRGAAGEFQVQCTFDFRIVITAVNQQGTPGSDGAPNIYSLGTVSVANRGGAGSVTVNETTEADPDDVYCSSLAEHYDTLTRQIEVRGTAPDGITPNTPPPDPNSSEDGEEAVGFCENPKGSLTWFVCPASSMMIESAEWLDTQIIDLLKVNGRSLFGTDAQNPQQQQSSDALRTAWGVFRNIAYILLVIIGLIMVVSQILGLDIFDAYTVRKMLPKLVFAAIIIPLLWPILALIFSIANDSADVVGQLIIGPFEGLGRDTNIFAFGADAAGMYALPFMAALYGALTVAGAGLFVAGGIGGFGVIVSVLAAALLAVASAVLILVARDIVAFLLVIVSPIAVICATFEPFKKAFVFWRTLLLTILMSIPAVAAVLAASKAGAIVAWFTHEMLGPLYALIFIIVGYVMFWPVFKQLDRVANQISNFTGRVTAPLQKMLSNYRNNEFKRRWEEGINEQKNFRGLAGLAVNIGQRFRAAREVGGGFTGERYAAGRKKIVRRAAQALLKEDMEVGDSSGDDELNEVLRRRPANFAVAVDALMARLAHTGITREDAVARLRRAEANYRAEVGSAAMADAASRALAKSNTSYQTGDGEDLDLQFQRRYGDIADAIIRGDTSIDEEAARLGDNPSRVEWMAGYTARRAAIVEAVERRRRGEDQALDAATIRQLRHEAVFGNDPGQIIGANQRSMVHVGTALRDAYGVAIREYRDAQAAYDALPEDQQDTPEGRRLRDVVASRRSDAAHVAARIANVYQYMSYAAGQKAEILASTLTAQTEDGTREFDPGDNRPIWQAIEEQWRNDPSFREVRQEFERRMGDQNDQMVRAGVGGVGAPR